jgi:YD repeat-containing protein
MPSSSLSLPNRFQAAALLIRRVLVTFAATLSVAPLAANAQLPYPEQIKQIRAPDAVTKVGADLFGDSVNLYTGTLEFRQVDVSLKGNNSLPVVVGRRVGTGSSSPYRTDRPFGQWDLDIPHVHGVFGATAGWTADGAASNRCSSFGAPSGTSGMSNAGYWDSDEFWGGNFLYVPGYGDQQMLLRDGANLRSPAWPAAATLYPIVTRDQWTFSCLPALKNASTLKKRTGEGFLAIAPDGTKYQFDWMVEYSTSGLSKSASASFASTTPVLTKAQPAETAAVSIPGAEEPATPDEDSIYRLPRNQVWILPTKITDRFGNFVTYTYDTTVPENLVSITSSDGRALTLTYVAGINGPTRQIETVKEITVEGTRTWKYTYIKTGTDLSVVELEKVTFPDASVLNVYGAVSLFHDVHIQPPPGCEDMSGSGTGGYVGVMTHPSGATGSFTLAVTTHGRSNVKKDCRLAGQSGESIVEVNLRPRTFKTMSLTRKEISGAGIETSAWTYDYGPANASWAPCEIGCSSTKEVTVTDPKGNKTIHRFGNRFNETEGQLQQTDVYEGSSILRSTFMEYQASGTNPYPEYWGYQSNDIGDAEQLRKPIPVKRRIVRQQGVDFIYEVNEFDYFARPKDVTKQSLPGAKRREITAFSENYPKWVLGLVDSVSEFGSGGGVGSTVMLANTYNATTANLETARKFGKLQHTLTYNANGSVASAKDEKNQITKFESYKRGIPQLITFADATKVSYVVDAFGNVASITNQNGVTTNYKYDLVNRVTDILPPVGGSVSWNNTKVEYAFMQSIEHDLGAGHLRQTITTGNSVEILYFDALYRQVMSYKYDRSDEAGTSRFLKTGFDIQGNSIYRSYPARNFASLGGAVRTEYDALGRVLAVKADSELGVLTSKNSYGDKFTTTATNNRNYVTTSTFQTFDEPSERAVSSMSAPEGVQVDIARDVFGKPTSITRGGGGKSATRSYVYDANHRLCKTIDPETGATVQNYDLANNLSVQAPGLALPSTTSCDNTAINLAKRIVFAYDANNRLLRTDFGDGSTPIVRTYWPDGNLKTIGAGGVDWTFTYNNLGLIETEFLSYATKTYSISRTYDGNASLTQLKYPDNSTVDYAPNALGEATKVGPYATGIVYHPNGAIKSFTYGNGINHTLTQNLRGLPDRSSDIGILSDVYTFDQNGNADAILDKQEGVTNRTMAYDGLDRLKQVSAPAVWGDAHYSYDSLDNLTRSNLTGGPGIARTMVHEYDSVNRLLRTTGTAGFAFDYAYDTRGNIISRGGQAFRFDLGNRLTSATGRGTYMYDGLGRRMSVVGTDGVNRLSLYSQDGQLLYVTPTGGAGTKYIYLHKHQIAEVKP